MMQHPPVRIFDIETFLLPDAEKYGRNTPRMFKEAGIGWMCVYAIEEKRVYHFSPSNAHDAADLLNGCILVGWNIEDFDRPLYENVTGITLRPAKMEDLFVSVKRVTGGTWVSVNEAAQFTLSRAKTGDGADAPALAQAGRWGELATYTQDDVMLEFHLWDFVRKHGYLRYADGIAPIQVTGGVPAWTWPHREPSEKMARAVQRLGYPVPSCFYEARKLMKQR